ncbi:dUTP diphosphatase [Staphylococcus massiliensis]|uniref:dUTP diphosphatase n=1 Tax=Staphylococcus massiliensis S46 TaxID=1229783 RepID=K9B997_9STAP|nr:dUTP diphosphatase [Staphylococcus massiliensis]EKU50330.1 dUTP pyrophosphatase [Staphylococcus massiliensis S46]
MLSLPIKLLTEHATMPRRANYTDSGIDLFTSEEITLSGHSTAIAPTGVAIDLPKGHEAQVRPRSGVTAKTKLRVQLGTIDQTYNKEIGIIVDNIGLEPVTIPKGKKLAQLVIQKVELLEPIEVRSLTNNSQREGFGSTGY